MDTLKVGDTVNWSGGFGEHAAIPAKIIDIRRTSDLDPKGEQSEVLTEVAWASVTERRYTFDLDNGHWCYAYQVRPLG